MAAPLGEPAVLAAAKETLYPDLLVREARFAAGGDVLSIGCEPGVEPAKIIVADSAISPANRVVPQ